MKQLYILLFSIGIVTPTLHADDAALLQRIVALEKRIDELETRLIPVLEEERVKDVVIQQQERAKERMLLDADVYPRPMLRDMERIYQYAMKDWKSEECIKALNALIKKYPLSNRAGCAVLNLGQMTEGSEQKDFLESACQQFNSCFYDNGVQVGAYARLYLGMRYKKEGKDNKANELFQQLKTKYPNAVDHTGKLISTHYVGMD